MNEADTDSSGLKAGGVRREGDWEAERGVPVVPGSDQDGTNAERRRSGFDED